MEFEHVHLGVAVQHVYHNVTETHLNPYIYIYIYIYIYTDPTHSRIIFRLYFKKTSSECVCVCIYSKLGSLVLVGQPI